MTIITYGGGEVLAKVFESISMLFYGQNEGLIRALMLLSASIGGFWILSETFFSQSPTKLISRFFFPLIIVVHLLLLPQTTVRIEDVTVLHSGDSTKRASIKVERVPLLLGKLSALVSSMGYKITQAIETVMHVPEDISYNKTGHIFGAENLLDASCYRIQNADLENNFRNFVHQCVFYDLALEKYTIEDMKKTTNLWDFFSNNTSKVRGILYSPPKGEGSQVKKASKTNFCSCKEAIERMRPFFEKEKNFYAKSEVFGRLPLSYQALTGLQQNAEDLISQQLVMNTITEDLNGGKASFATSRAYTKQRETFQVLGSLTAKSLITMRNVLEALIYAAFIFIAPAALLPNGIKFLTTWAGLVIWLQLWPPFFSILNYIMQIAAQSKIQAIFGPNPGLSFFTSVGLRDLYSDMHAVAGYLAASIPFLTYAILKGGVGSFVHLASSIMTPAHSAAATAAEEKVSGNYSFGNVNWGNLQAYNTSAFKRHAAPALTTGSFTEDTGRGGVTYSSDGEIFYKQNKSDLRTSIQKNDSFTTSLQEAHQDAQTYVDTETENYAKSINSFASSSASLVEHFSKNHQGQDGFSSQFASTDQKAIHDLGNLSEKFGERFGMDRRSSTELLVASSAGGGLNFFGLGKVHAEGSHRYSKGTSNSEVLDAANEFVHTEQFQEHWQQYLNTTAQMNHQELSDEGARYHEDMQSSYQSVENSQESLQKALSNMEQVSETISLTKSNNMAVQHALDQSFVNWVTEKEHSFEKGREILDRNDMDPQKTRLIQEFVKSGDWKSFDIGESAHLVKDAHLTEHYQEKTIQSPIREDHVSREEILQKRAEDKTQIHFGDVKNAYQQSKREVTNKLHNESEAYPGAKEDILKRGKTVHKDVSKEIKKGTVSKIHGGPREGKWKGKIEEGGQVFANKKFGAKDLIERLLKTKKET